MTEPDIERCEAAANELVAFMAKMGLTRQEVATTCLAIATNHMIATGVPQARAVWAVGHLWQARQGCVTEGILVPAKKE